MRVSTVIFGARPRLALSRLFRSGSSVAFPFTTSARLLRKRSDSLGFSSSVRCNLCGRMHREISPRESFEEPFDLFDGGVARLRLHALEQRAFIRCVQAIAIYGAAEVI